MKSCINCKYAGPMLTIEDQTTAHQCRFNPPTISEARLRFIEKSDIDYDDETEYATTWPVVTSDAWCGKWEQLGTTGG